MSVRTFRALWSAASPPVRSVRPRKQSRSAARPNIQPFAVALATPELFCSSLQQRRNSPWSRRTRPLSQSGSIADWRGPSRSPLRCRISARPTNRSGSDSPSACQRRNVPHFCWERTLLAPKENSGANRRSGCAWTCTSILPAGPHPVSKPDTTSSSDWAQAASVVSQKGDQKIGHSRISMVKHPGRSVQHHKTHGGLDDEWCRQTAIPSGAN